MIFADYDEYETAKVQLKEELKTRVTQDSGFIIHICRWGLWFDCERTKPAFLKFTKGHKHEWCDKVSLLYETGLESVVLIARQTKTLNLELLHLYIENFFEYVSHDLFYEDWFTCSKCFKSTHSLSDDTNLCTDCEDSTTEK